MKTVVAMQANCGQVGLKLYKTMSICFRKSCVADDIKGQANTQPKDLLTVVYIERHCHDIC